MDEMVAKMVELRKGKMSEEECRAALAKGNYFGTMLVKMGKADALLGGATYSTADTVRPALQLVKTKKGAHLVSSSFILFRKDKDGNDEKYCMGDCAINIDYPDTLDKATGEVDLLRRAEAGGGCCRVRADRCLLRHRPEGRAAVLLHQGLRQGRHCQAQPRRHHRSAEARPRACHRRRNAV